MDLKIGSSLKIRRRYLLIEAKNREDIEEAILDAIGVLGWANAKPVFVTTSNSNRKILSIERGSLNNIRAAFELSKNKIKIIRVSGTLRGLNKI